MTGLLCHGTLSVGRHKVAHTGGLLGASAFLALFNEGEVGLLHLYHFKVRLHDLLGMLNEDLEHVTTLIEEQFVHSKPAHRMVPVNAPLGLGFNLRLKTIYS
jgi:hypothetical protein